jgi:hypothetical protein
MRAIDARETPRGRAAPHRGGLADASPARVAPARRSFTTPPIVAAGGYDGSVCGSLGAAGPVELPSAQEVARYSRQWTSPIRALSSPVFLSTGEDGRVVQGLGALPNDRRPILFVGNHQVSALRGLAGRRGRLLASRVSGAALATSPAPPGSAPCRPPQLAGKSQQPLPACCPPPSRSCGPST